MTKPNRPILDGAALLDAVHAAIVRYVVMPSRSATDAVTLWIAATHAQIAWAHAPRLVIRAPEKRCGKSRLLDIVEALSRDPFLTVNASPAAVYRSINADPPTMLVDEADTIFGPKADGNEDLRGLLNAGHQRNRPAVRYDAATNSVQTWRRSRWPRSPGSAPCPTRSRTGPSSSGCGAARPGKRSPCSGTAATDCRCKPCRSN